MGWLHGNLITWKPTNWETPTLLGQWGIKEAQVYMSFKRSIWLMPIAPLDVRSPRDCIGVSSVMIPQYRACNKRDSYGFVERINGKTSFPESGHCAVIIPSPLSFSLQHLTQYPQRNRVEVICKRRNGANPSPTDLTEGRVGGASHSCHSGLRPGTLGQSCVN